jgi:hypothetical protein
MTHMSAVAARAARPAGQRAGSVAKMILGIGLTLTVAAVVLAWFGSSLAAGPVESHSYMQSMNGALRSSTHLQFNAGTLTVDALDDGADMLAMMRYNGPANLRPEPSYRVRGGIGELGYVAGRDAEGRLLGLPVVIHGENASMHLRLAQDVPLALTLEFGAGESDLDLTGLRVTNVDLQSGAGRSRILLPESAGLTVVTVSGGVGQVALQIPTGVAADIQVSGGIGSREVDQVRFRSLGGGHYRSPDYETAANRVELRANLGVGELIVN